MAKIKLVKQFHQVVAWPYYVTPLIEQAGRTCYKSEDKITEGTAPEFIERLIRKGHLSVIEHASATVKFVTNRGVTHELVRHRLASYSQESTRYVNYGGKPIEFIIPVWSDLEEGEYKEEPPDMNEGDTSWYMAMNDCAIRYQDLLDMGWRPEQAREVLPNSLKTEIVMTANMREWRHVFQLRCSKAAHPQMKALMAPLLKEFQEREPSLFKDIEL